jgi:hypothetical protein
LAAEARLPPLIRAMMCPEFYRHPADSLELRQTHISYVLLAGDYVYKIKKPVRFAFLDYSTLEKRRHFCHEEIRLNRRLASSIYLDVVSIRRERERFVLGDSPQEEGAVVEYAVKMRRLSEEHLLDRRIKSRTVQKEDFKSIAKKLAHFYETAATEKARVYGSSELIGRKLEENLKEADPFVGETVSDQELQRIREYNERFFGEHADLLHRRTEQARVREGHGDLRAEHIWLAADPVIFDCIEFNEELRYCDAASEIAFLSMDLDYLGIPMLSEDFVRTFQALTEDPDLPVLLPLYKSYRACVRGKVESLKSREREVPESERDEAKSRARRYFNLALRYVSPAFPRAIVVVCGQIASGKSTVARHLGDRTGYQILNSDVARKELAGIPLTSHPEHGYGTGIYSDQSTNLTYEKLLRETENCLNVGIGVVVDATFKDASHRRKFLDLAGRSHVPILFVECQASPEKTLERLRKRQQAAGEVSDATVAVYLRQRAEFMPLTEIADLARIIVNTESDPAEAADSVTSVLRRMYSSAEVAP